MRAGDPRVARDAQPWAKLCNAVGVQPPFIRDMVNPERAQSNAFGVQPPFIPAVVNPERELSKAFGVWMSSRMG